MERVTLEDVKEAREIIKEVALKTDLLENVRLSEKTGARVFYKCENLQRTGSFKLRGAYNKIAHLTEEEKECGVIASSAGNHAQGVAYAAQCYGVKAVIVMPTTTPLIKVERTKAYGAEVVLYGDVYDQACEKAYELAAKKGYTFIHPFDDLRVATGQGTIAMEVIQELPLVDYILVPIGGGGLATGVSTLAKLLNPKIKVIAVEPTGAACLKASLEAGEVTTVSKINTIADGTGWEYETEIEEICETCVTLRIVDRQKDATEPQTRVTLFQGVPKAAKMETVIQKTVELGVDAIVPVFTARTVVVEKGNFSKKLMRWQKIADEAVKQCKRGRIPRVEPQIDFAEM